MNPLDPSMLSILGEYRLIPYCQGLYRHSDHTQLVLNGQTHADTFLHNVHLDYIGVRAGQLPELWAGDPITFTTVDGVLDITTPDPIFRALLMQFVALAVKDILRYLDPLNLHGPPASLIPLHVLANNPFTLSERDMAFFLAIANEDREDILPPERPLRELSQSERLDRARALTGQHVLDVTSTPTDEYMNTFHFVASQPPQDEEDPLGPLSEHLEMIYRINRAESPEMDDPDYDND